MNSSFITEAFLTTLVCLTNFNEESTTGIDVRVISDPIHFNNEVDQKCPSEELNGFYFELLSLNDTLNQQIQKIFRIRQGIKQLDDKIRAMQMEPPRKITSCTGQPNGLASIKSETFGNLLVYCDHNQGVYGGNWLMIAKRDIGGEDFYRTWNEYKEGFGDILKEFFFGLEKIHDITSSHINELLIYLERRTGETAYAHYDAFSIGSEKEKFRLKLLGNYSGTAGDALRFHSGLKFTTRDRDNDQHPTQNCARVHAAAWWYDGLHRQCMESNLFGIFQTFWEPDIKYSKGILWKGFLDGPLGSIKVAKMYIRPKQRK